MGIFKFLKSRHQRSIDKLDQEYIRELTGLITDVEYAINREEAKSNPDALYLKKLQKLLNVGIERREVVKSNRVCEDEQ